MADSNGDWGRAPTDTHAEQWDRLPQLPEAGEDKLFDKFCASKGLTREDLVRIGTRWTSRDGHACLVWLFPDGFKYRRLIDGHRTSEEGVNWRHFKRVGTGSKQAVIAEGETDGATLARLQPSLDVLILPNGARNVTPEMVQEASRYERVYIGTDNDEAGQAAAGKFLDQLPAGVGVRIVPPKGKDWTEAATVGAVGENFDLSGVSAQGIPSIERWPSRAPIKIDFAAEIPPAEWVVEDLIEAGTITIMSADTGVGKSIFTNALIYSVLSGNYWLDRVTTHVPIVLVDEENSARLITRRLKGMGVTNEMAEDLVIYNRIGCELGKSDWNQWLRAVSVESSAGLIIIDTVGACTTAEVNNNDAVVQLYKHAFKPLTEDGTAVLLLHHERKDRLGEPRMPGQAMMGARQWAGQADTHLALKLTSPADHNKETRTTTTQVTMEVPKTRDGISFRPELIEVFSEWDDDRGSFKSFRISSLGEAPDKVSEVERVAEELAAVIRQGGSIMRRKDLIEIAGRPASTVDKALAHAVETLGISKEGPGLFTAEPAL